ncbi:MAG: M23 family metallopeptidase [Clostridia bacterium]|nr:M23 family metallopeptidase [Clostridia bacterium]
MPEINGIKLATLPITGTITSRYGVSSNIRKSTHTGLDIAAAKGTPIKVVADGTIIAASYNGSYGNLVKVEHGKGIETWYAHTSKMYVTVGQPVTAGEVIAAVGSTGNSTGNHLHLEIRINGKHVNPQKYLYH